MKAKSQVTLVNEVLDTKHNTHPLFFLVAVVGLAAGLVGTARAQQDLSLEDRVIHHRALEAIVWSIPMVSSKMMRDGLQRDAGVGLNDVAYFSKMQNWKINFTTNNNTTPYIHFFWNAEKEPVVIEIPASTPDVGLVGTLLDFWQRSMIAVGAAGFDGGRGGKYLILSPDYQGAWLGGLYRGLPEDLQRFGNVAAHH